MGLRFGTLPPSGEPLQYGKLIVVRSVRWSRPGFDLIQEQAKAHGLDYTTYVRQAALRQAERDAERRQSGPDRAKEDQ
jgi:hypothetical protein